MFKLERRRFVQLGAAFGAATLVNPVREALASATPAPAPTADELVTMTLAEATRRMRAREITSTQMTEAFLARIAIYNPKINAFITVMHDVALAQAKQRDDEARAGHFRGPLHGIPILLKDNIDTAGTRTTAASLVLDDNVPTEDAFITARLKAAGAVFLGKANMHEFAMGHTSSATYFGPVRNPWAPDHTPAGSSGGCGAAVIADLCTAAIGTDTGGSVRMPAAYCSIVGLKPTYGLVSIRGIIPLTYSLDHCGPMTRTVEDAAIMLTAMAAYDKLDVASVEHAPEDYTQSMKQPVGKLRLGIPRAPYFDRLDTETSEAIEAAIVMLSKLTASTKEVTLPGTHGFNALALGAETEAYHLELYRKSKNGYSMSIRRGIEGGVKGLDDVSDQPCSEKVVEYINSSWALTRLRRTIDDAFTDFDLVALPTMRLLPPTINESLSREEDPKPREPEIDNNCQPFDVFGIPAISIPCGFSKTGLPIGLMIAGPRFSEGRVLALAHAYEQATDWHKRKPALSPDMVIPSVNRKS
jgi:aspartyl-tRNA(Asn)/glutamyl-tRNA(Gln) amidotransferase subunit A